MISRVLKLKGSFFFFENVLSLIYISETQKKKKESSLAFDTVNHKILISKLDRIQFIKYNNSNTSFQSIVCGVPQGSILEPLLFLICVNGLKDASKSFVLIMLAEVTNIFYSHKNIKGLFYTANLELEK